MIATPAAMEVPNTTPFALPPAMMAPYAFGWLL